MLGTFITFFAIKNHNRPSSGYDPTQMYVVPDIYSAQLQFRLPYMKFTETLEADVDSINGLMRLSYFGGMDTYIFNAAINQKSYSIVPVYTTLTCLEQSSNNSFQALFPNLTLFTKQDDRELITIPIASTGKSQSFDCDVWSFSGGVVEITNSTAELPVNEIYSGNYTFYVDSVSGI